MALLVRSQLAALARQHLQDRGISTAGLRAPDANDLWEIEELHRFLEACATRTKNPWLGIDLAITRKVGSHGIAEFLWRSATTTREGLNALASHSRLLNDVARLELVERGQQASFVQHVAHPAGMGRHGNNFFLVILTRELRALVAPEFVPTRVRVAHTHAPGDLVRLREVLGTRDVVWGSEVTGIDFEAHWLDKPILTADAALLETLRAHAKSWLPWVASAPDDSLIKKLEALLRTSAEASTLSSAARTLGVSARTLQRRLTEDGRAFHSMRDAAFAERAQRLLASSGSIKEVAIKMGYASSAAFVRAFRRWTGSAPAAWRALEKDRH